jgi:hypothetical protein
MATVQEVNELFERIRRVLDRVAVTVGSGTEWKAEVPGHGVHTYKITGMKSPSDIEDDLATLAVWVWSLKDHLKTLFSSLGRDPNDVERCVDSEADLRVCADIANSAKHSVLTHSRTGRFVRAGRLRFSIPQSAVSALTFRAAEVQIDVSQPEQVAIELPVVDKAGKVVGDGIVHLRNAVRAWERYVQQLGLVA